MFCSIVAELVSYLYSFKIESFILLFLRFDWELVNGDLSAWSPCHSNLIIPDDVDIYSENTSVSQHISLTPGATGDFQLRCTSLQHLDIYKGCGDNCSKTINIRVTTHGGGGGGTSDVSHL